MSHVQLCTMIHTYNILAITVVYMCTAQARDIQEFIPLINQLIVKYKERLVSVLEEIFMPVCASIVALLNIPFDADDLEVCTYVHIIHTYVCIVCDCSYFVVSYVCTTYF